MKLYERDHLMVCHHSVKSTDHMYCGRNMFWFETRSHKITCLKSHVATSIGALQGKSPSSQVW